MSSRSSPAPSTADFHLSSGGSNPTCDGPASAGTRDWIKSRRISFTGSIMASHVPSLRPQSHGPHQLAAKVDIHRGNPERFVAGVHLQEMSYLPENRVLLRSQAVI